MKFITRKDRNQIGFFYLEQAIQDYEVQLISLFVASIKLTDLGFDTQSIGNGMISHHLSTLHL